MIFESGRDTLSSERIRRCVDTEYAVEFEEAVHRFVHAEDQDMAQSWSDMDHAGSKPV